jgi:hypothetical protein
MKAKPSPSGQWAEQQKIWQRKEQKKEQKKSETQQAAPETDVAPEDGDDAAPAR